MIDWENYDTTTALGTAQYFGDVLETMIGESWFRANYPDQYVKMHDLCKDMRAIVDIERQHADNNSSKTDKN